MIPAAKPLSPEEKRQLVVKNLSREHEDFKQGYEAIKSDAPGRDYAVDALIEYCQRSSVERLRILREKFKEENRYKTEEFLKVIRPFYQKLKKYMKAEHYPMKIGCAIKRSTGTDGKMKPDSEIDARDRKTVMAFGESSIVMEAYLIFVEELYNSDLNYKLGDDIKISLHNRIDHGMEEPFNFNSNEDLNFYVFKNSIFCRCNPLANDILKKLIEEGPDKAARMIIDLLINRTGLGRLPHRPPRKISHK